jgi:hypothetical protein
MAKPGEPSWPPCASSLICPPRIWKATITGRLCEVEIEVRGASPNELSQWLWDFDTRPISEVPPDLLAAAARVPVP